MGKTEKPAMHIYSNFGWAHVHDYMAIVHSSFEPSEKEWLQSQLYSMRYPAKGALVFTIWVPDGKKRQDLFKTFNKTPCALLCTSKIARAALAVMSVRNPIKGFNVDQINEAMNWLKIPPSHQMDFFNAFNSVAEQVLNSSEIQVLRPQ